MPAQTAWQCQNGSEETNTETGPAAGDGPGADAGRGAAQVPGPGRSLKSGTNTNEAMAVDITDDLDVIENSLRLLPGLVGG